MDLNQNNTGGFCNSPSSSMERDHQKTGRLKFGIDRLLEKDNEHVSQSFVAKPLATVGIPCSDCVSSLFRCCIVNPNFGPKNHQQDYFAHHQHPEYEHSTNVYTIQPVKPFATRPGIRIPQLSAASSTTSAINLTTATSTCATSTSKRKRSWSRAVFSNLQRKGLERRFQLQKYITKPDRRQLAATLGLTDAQVKVWFQNRRMKWRHSKEASALGESGVDSTQDSDVQIDVDGVTDTE